MPSSTTPDTFLFTSTLQEPLLARTDFDTLYLLPHPLSQPQPRPPPAPRLRVHSYPASSSSEGTLNNPTYASFGQRVRELLSSRCKHYFIITLVSLDVTVILTRIFVSLVACDLHLDPNEGWVGTTKEVLHPISLVLTCLFLGELGLSVCAFGLKFFSEWFHWLDAAVIIISFVVDVFVKGLVEEIVSIVIVLRLWRVVKIVQEVSVGAAERIEELEGRIVELEREYEELRGR
ncbi:hypothetical protein QBC44DRAFT_322471 [Cladorrhinum sp. PSN332]|nr:hypothetical protein QBC44DRAFT_322471 [Cladorrhinum sp. PSN332]